MAYLWRDKGMLTMFAAATATNGTNLWTSGGALYNILSMSLVIHREFRLLQPQICTDTTEQCAPRSHLWHEYNYNVSNMDYSKQGHAYCFAGTTHWPNFCVNLVPDDWEVNWAKSNKLHTCTRSRCNVM